MPGESKLQSTSSKRIAQSLRRAPKKAVKTISIHGKGKLKATRDSWRRIRQMNLYKAPTNHVDWEALEKSHGTQWADLFFDLTYVSLAFKLGYIFTHSLTVDYDIHIEIWLFFSCLLYTSPSPRDLSTSRMPSSA